MDQLRQHHAAWRSCCKRRPQPVTDGFDGQQSWELGLQAEFLRPDADTARHRNDREQGQVQVGSEADGQQPRQVCPAGAPV